MTLPFSNEVTFLFYNLALTIQLFLMADKVWIEFKDTWVNGGQQPNEPNHPIRLSSSSSFFITMK